MTLLILVHFALLPVYHVPPLPPVPAAKTPILSSMAHVYAMLVKNYTTLAANASLATPSSITALNAPILVV